MKMKNNKEVPENPKRGALTDNKGKRNFCRPFCHPFDNDVDDNEDEYSTICGRVTTK